MGSSKVRSYVRVDADKVRARSGREELHGRDVFVVPGDVTLGKSAKLGHR